MIVQLRLLVWAWRSCSGSKD